MNKLIIASVILAFSCTTQKEETSLRIAAAANTRFVLDSLIETYTHNKSIDIEPVYASSGQLTAQIVQGAKYHLFISADMSYPEYLYEKGYGAGEPEIYAKGTLIIWSAHNDSAFLDLSGKQIRQLAIANPELAPYGKAAQEYLSNTGSWDELVPIIVYGNSISQTNQYIVNKSVDTGITARSAVMEGPFAGIGCWKPLPEKYHAPIDQGLLLLKSDPRSEATAADFRSFLTSETAITIFEHFGYEIDE